MTSQKGYKKKRELNKTPEPKDKRKKSSLGKPVFVIQKHEAQNLHYDLRLEVNRVLKSWAVPKGPSTDTSEKRLAIPVEHHPLEYAGFEGAILEDQYGAGTVMIWDKGTYVNIKKEKGKEIPMEKCYNNGRIEVFLDGRKISGGYALIQPGKLDGNWLLIKKDDDFADARRNPTSTENRSVHSGRTLREIEVEEQKERGE